MSEQENEQRFDATDESCRTRVVIGRKDANGQMAWHTDDGRTLHQVSPERYEIIPTGEVLKTKS